MLSQRQLFLQHVAQTSPSPLSLEIEKAEGIYLMDKNGKRYTDLISGIAVSNLGHCHPKITEAVQAQMKKHAHLMVYGEYVQYPQVKFAEKLASLLPEKLNCTYFTNSGAEATEGAMKLSKRITGRTEIISFNNSYHGSTQGALSIMGSETFKTNYRPLLPGTKQLDYNIIEQLNEITHHTAAVFVEVVQAESGVLTADKNWLMQIRRRCDETGALLVFDEIQTGFGRTGKLFGFEHFSIVPDILLIGKALGGGLPLGAFISSRELMNAFTTNPVLGHITTFGGNPVCCAAGLAALETLLEEKWMDQVDEISSLLDKLKHPKIKAIRKSGLLCSIDFHDADFNFRVIHKCMGRGVITDWFLFNAGAMRIAPPLIISKKQFQESLHVIQECIEQVN